MNINPQPDEYIETNDSIATLKSINHEKGTATYIIRKKVPLKKHRIGAKDELHRRDV